MKSKYFLYLAWAQSLAALLGSLYFSEILKLPPCLLCWYQRIVIFPLFPLLTIGILFSDKKVYRYCLPLALIGWPISFYHNLLYYKILPENLAPCSAGISCTTRLVEYFGFITIPLLALICLTVIIVSLLLYRHHERRS